MISWKLFVIIIIASVTIHTQTVFEPVTSDIYDLLERFYIDGAIEYHSEIKPISRKEIAGYLLEALLNQSKLTQLDIQELKFYTHEFADEILCRRTIAKLEALVTSNIFRQKF
jgi:hypothetical protein